MDKPLSEKEIDRLFMSGDRDLHRGNSKDAVDVFEELLEILEPSHHLYFNIQRNLIKAYQQNEQLDKAIVLCELLIGSGDSTASIWGNSFMSQLNPQFIPESEPEPEVEKEARDNTPMIRIKQKTLAQFKNYCQDNLLEKLKQLEKERIQTLITIIVSGIICLIATWGFSETTTNFLHLENNLIFYLLCLSFSGTAWVFFCQGCLRVYGLGFKRGIIEKIINFIDDTGSLEYANSLLIEDRRQMILAFTRSQIFRDELHEPDNLEQEDCVYGTIGKTDLFFAEITVEDLKEGYLNEFEVAEYRGKSLLFHGLFFEAKFSKSFVSRTFILPQTFKNKLGMLNNWRGENIDLEDPEFKKMFQVYGDNQVESRYILATSLMSRLVDFRKKAKRQVYLSFVDGFVYIAIPYKYNLFEPKLFTKMTSFTPLREYFRDLQLMIGIVDDLNLNLRIWGKNK